VRELYQNGVVAFVAAVSGRGKRHHSGFRQPVVSVRPVDVIQCWLQSNSFGE